MDNYDVVFEIQHLFQTETKNGEKAVCRDDMTYITQSKCYCWDNMCEEVGFKFTNIQELFYEAYKSRTVKKVEA